MKVVDVNILLYAVNDQADKHDRIRRGWEAALNGDESVGLPWLVLSGFLRLSTNPKIFPTPLPVNLALARVTAWLDARMVTTIGEKPNHWDVLRKLLSETGTAGNLTTDAHLATLAITHDATLASCDNDFIRFQHLRSENPCRG